MCTDGQNQNKKQTNTTLKLQTVFVENVKLAILHRQIVRLQGNALYYTATEQSSCVFVFDVAGL